VTGRWLVGKVLAAILTLLFVIVFNFFLFRVMGDPTSQLARLPQSTPQEIKQLQKLVVALVQQRDEHAAAAAAAAAAAKPDPT